MPEVYLDKVENLKCSESRGVIRSCESKARVIFQPVELQVDNRNQNVLSLALIALDDLGIRWNATFGVIGSNDSRFNNLVLVGRDASVAVNDPCCIDVILKWEHVLDGQNQIVRRPPNGIIFGKGRCSIVEKPTNFFYPKGIKAGNQKTQIVVGHTYSAEDQGILNMPFVKNMPRTVIQGGEVTIPFPQENFQFQGIVHTNSPLAMAQSLVAKVNKQPWLGRVERSYICSEVQWEMNDAAPRGVYLSPSYRMSFEFQYNSDTWDPAVVFLDQRTGRPPATVVEATAVAVEGPAGVVRMAFHPDNGEEMPAGYWKVPVLEEVDFQEFFGGLFEMVILPEAPVIP